MTFDVIEYRNLTTQNVVRPFNMYGDISLSAEKQVGYLITNLASVLSICITQIKIAGGGIEVVDWTVDQEIRV